MSYLHCFSSLGGNRNTFLEDCTDLHKGMTDDGKRRLQTPLSHNRSEQNMSAKSTAKSFHLADVYARIHTGRPSTSWTYILLPSKYKVGLQVENNLLLNVLLLCSAGWWADTVAALLPGWESELPILMSKVCSRVAAPSCRKIQ